VFGRRKREQAAAAEAAREAERRELFAKLAQRPEHICPFLGLASDRAGYVEGVSDDHRCYAFGDPAALSAEQQTRVCQERGYGNCPRYLRGVLVIPTEELEALRRPRPAEPVAAPAPPAEPVARRRRRGPLVALLVVLLLAVLGAGAWALLGGGLRGIADPGPSTSESPAPPSIGASASSSPSASAEPSATQLATPTPEPTPELGDAFAFYEVSVGPGEYELYQLDDAAEVIDTRTVPFTGFSFARAVAQADPSGTVYWVTLNGDLAGYGYRAPDSGPFRIRAVFLSPEDERRSVYLADDALDVLPSAEPTPPPPAPSPEG
jgi:hypothetical protein